MYLLVTEEEPGFLDCVFSKEIYSFSKCLIFFINIFFILPNAIRHTVAVCSSCGSSDEWILQMNVNVKKMII